ncbi:MAG: ribonuclease HII [Desulfuromonadaceae bacterium]|nr:ribonuclease HII [Desulfuromonadaceae bacterium]MDD2849099.1 ribonuclease HII [Desulfuromonadaceae bacterium]MDD4129467.1 ribonuclease HII [Desulfuromonadaceae bacterium]
MTLQGELFSAAPLSIDTLLFEKSAYNSGFTCVAGIDEAGRGPLAGPVTAAAVILPVGLLLPGVDDSKKLSPDKREKLFDTIMAQALSVGVGSIDPAVIDQINILQATRCAMLAAVKQLIPQPDYLLIDGISTIESTIAQKTIKKGDSLSLSIAAASIIAKVTRDRLMIEMDSKYPGYGFSGHKGYGSASHMDAIKRLGPSPIHRLTFRGVKEYVDCTSS